MSNPPPNRFSSGFCNCSSNFTCAACFVLLSASCLPLSCVLLFSPCHLHFEYSFIFIFCQVCRARGGARDGFSSLPGNRPSTGWPPLSNRVGYVAERLLVSSRLIVSHMVVFRFNQGSVADF